MKNWFKKRKKLKIALLVFLLIFIIGCIVANRYVKKHGYRNLWDFITTVSSNYNKSRSAKFETLEMEIDKQDLKKLENIREKALKRGVLIDEQGSFVDATLRHNGKKIKAKVRLKGHMTDHLQQDKWSFRVITKKGDAFMGMKRFSLQHPGTRNYIYEWIYHQMMKQEGIVSLRYTFVKLKVNKKDWGVYALEEHFSQQLVENNQRLKGPIIRFSPELYWTFRINELNRIKILQEYTQFQSSYVEAYDDQNTFGDSTLLNRYAKAVQLIEAFRRGQLNTSQVFDIDKLAKFHAIIDLVGGHRSLDWSDVKYYYNDATAKLEPVAYESFSIQPVWSLAGSYKFTGQNPAYITDLHEALFNDPVFFAAYISNLQRIASRKWLDTFLKSIDEPLQNNLAILYKEFPYKKYTPEDYYRNIEHIQHILNATKGFHAFLNHVSKDSIYLDLGGIDALPYEVQAVMVRNRKLTVPSGLIIASKGQNQYVQYKTVAFALPQQLYDSITTSSKVKILYRLLGANTQQKEMEVIPVPAYDPGKIPGLTGNREANAGEFGFVIENSNTKEIRVMPGNYTLTHDLVFPSGYKIYIGGGTRFNLENGSGIYTSSPLYISGTEDSPVVISSSDSSGKGITMLGTGSNSQLKEVQLLNQACGLVLYESDAVLQACAFIHGSAGIHVIRSSVTINGCVFEGLRKEALEADYAKLELKDDRFLHLQDNGVSAKGSVVTASGIMFENIGKTALYGQVNTQVKAKELTFLKVKVAVESKDASLIDISAVSLTNCDLGFKASKKGDVFGPATINVKKLKEKNNKVLKEAEKKSVINIQQ